MSKFNWKTATYQEVANEVYTTGSSNRLAQQMKFYKRMLVENPGIAFYVEMVDKLSKAYKHLKYLKSVAVVASYEGSANE